MGLAMRFMGKQAEKIVMDQIYAANLQVTIFQLRSLLSSAYVIKCIILNGRHNKKRKKAAAKGYTTVGAKAELYIYDPSGTRQLVAANVRDVDIKIKEIMLIDSNQFRQILMIPQGEFRKLLTSDSKEKETILQRLFHTEKYKKIEEKLKEEATELKNAVEMQTNDRNQAIRTYTSSFP